MYEDHVDFTATRSEVYAEWGATDLWTISGKYEQVDIDEFDFFDSEGWRLTARRRLWADDHWSVTAGGGFLEGAAIGGFRGCETLGTEFNIGAGRSGALFARNYYAGVTYAYRTHEESCEASRVEAVIGYHLTEDSEVILQYWGQRGDPGLSDKVEILNVHRFGPVGIGGGLRTEFGGDFEETSVVFSVSFQN